jgi:tRNA A-37 threonylcarbamoyl transferase component Bud32
MPYRWVVQVLTQGQELERLVDAMVVLLVRLHLNNFFWGDVSLSNVLFRRNAGELAAYLVDAETGEFTPSLSDLRRDYDVEVGTENVFAELLDLQAAGVLAPDTDPHEVVLHMRDRYEELWSALTEVREFPTDEMWQIERWVEDLHCRGFDVEEMDIVTTDEGRRVQLRPVVVEAGHHARTLQALTSLQVEEAQAARLLQDISAFAAHLGMAEQPRELVAQRWLAEIYRPLTQLMPPEMAATTPPAQFFHELLVHRWYLSEQAGQEVDTFEAARDLIERFGAAIAATGVRDPAR